MKEHPLRFTGPKYVALPGKPSPFARYSHVKHIKTYRTDQNIADSEIEINPGSGPVDAQTLGGGGEATKTAPEAIKQSHWGEKASLALSHGLQGIGTPEWKKNLDTITAQQQAKVEENKRRAINALS